MRYARCSRPVVIPPGQAQRKSERPIARRRLSNTTKIHRSIVLTAKRCRNTAWGFNPRKGPNGEIISPDKGAGFQRLTP